MNKGSTRGKVFPDYFYSKDRLNTKTESVDYGDGLLRWINTVDDGQSSEKNKQQLPYNYQNLAPYEDNDEGLVDCAELEETYDIVFTKSGKLITSFYVPAALHSVIIGPRGTQLKQLQENTNTIIKVPRLDEAGDVKITGHNERSVASARNQIAMIVLNKRERMAVTHFVSVPVFSETIKNNLKIFKTEILNEPATRGIDDTIFQNPEKLHLTIATLTLLDHIEIEEAKKTLTSCYKNVIEPLFSKNKKYRISLKGVEIMNDDPTDVDVLYGKVKLDTPNDTNNFQEMADGIADYFYKKGLIRKKYDNVKLHVTLMNSLFRRKPDNYDRPGEDGNKRESFDASHIMKKYSGFYFGSCTFENVQLSIRFTTGKDLYYESALTVPINSS